MKKASKGAKRDQRGEVIRDDNVETMTVDYDFIKKCSQDFEKDKSNKLIRNSLTVVGIYGICSNSDAMADISHLFNHSIKMDGTVATTQEHTGRCWMFAGMNMFRHFIMKALGIENFEFSANYLFFYDKLERANAFMEETIRTRELATDNFYIQDLLSEPIIDGGFFSTFINLVDKYGLVPKSCMSETVLSDDSDDLNEILGQILRRFAITIRRKYNRMSSEEVMEYRQKILAQVHNILTKALGTPPQTFDWQFQTSARYGPDGNKLPAEVKSINGIDPHRFAALGLCGTNLDDYFTFSNYPTRTYHKLYELDEIKAGMIGGRRERFLNIKMRDLKQMTMNSIIAGFPVWFGCDVRKNLHIYKYAFDDRLFDYEMVFGDIEKLNKGDRLTFHEVVGNHAMVFVGVNLPDPNEMVADWWQVENSWDYICNIPGLNGFYCAADNWFDEHVVDVCIHKNFVLPHLLPLFSQDPIVLGPLDPICHSRLCS